MRDARTPLLHVGTAGWNVPRAAAERFAGPGSHLQRYSRVMNCVEINTSFYRDHQAEVYARWAEQTPPGFRFALKLPRAITHDARLRASRVPLQRFLAQAMGLRQRLAVVLVQLPPSLPFELRSARKFFGLLGDLFGGAVVCEPRHQSWFAPSADRLLISAKVGRVAADPARWPAAALPGGWRGPNDDGAGAVLYHRWHGSPRTYWSTYGDAWLHDRATERLHWSDAADCWYVFDNTASGAAIDNALAFNAFNASSRVAPAGRSDRS